MATKNKKVFGSAEEAPRNKQADEKPIEVTFYGEDLAAKPRISGTDQLKFMSMLPEDDDNGSGYAKALWFYLEKSFSSADLKKIERTGAGITELNELISFLLETRTEGS